MPVTTPEQIVLCITGEAAPQGSKRYIGNGRMLESSKRVKPWRNVVVAAARDAMNGRRLIDGPVRVDIEFVFSRPASHLNTRGEPNATGRRTPYPYSRGDLDKLMRSIGDALTHNVYTDDRLIVSAAIDKRWAEPGEPAETVIVITPIPHGDEA